jgi:hypothetical protein
VIIPCSQNRNGPLTGAPGPVEIFFQISELRSNLQIQKEANPCSKNIPTLHGDRIEYFEQLSQLVDFIFST